MGGGGFIFKGVAEALGDVVMISAADRCSAVLRLAGVQVVAVLAAPPQRGGGCSCHVGSTRSVPMRSTARRRAVGLVPVASPRFGVVMRCAGSSASLQRRVHRRRIEEVAGLVR